MKDLQSAHVIASFAITHAESGNLSSIQAALLEHFLDSTGKSPDLQIVNGDFDAAIELLETAAFMLRDQRHDCIGMIQSLEPKE